MRTYCAALTPITKGGRAGKPWICRLEPDHEGPHSPWVQLALVQVEHKAEDH